MLIPPVILDDWIVFQYIARWHQPSLVKISFGKEMGISATSMILHDICNTWTPEMMIHKHNKFFKANGAESSPSKHPKKKARKILPRMACPNSDLQVVYPIAEVQWLKSKFCVATSSGMAAKVQTAGGTRSGTASPVQTASFQFGMNVNPQCISCLIGKCPIFVADPHPSTKQRGLDIHAWTFEASRSDTFSMLPTAQCQSNH